MDDRKREFMFKFAVQARFKKFTVVSTAVAVAFLLLGTRALASQTPPHAAHPLTGEIAQHTFVVTSTADSGDNTHADKGTLRRALVDANNTAGLDRIVFDFPGSGVRTIRVVNYFPDLTDNAGVIIDGLYRADGSRNDDRIEIDASGTRGHHTFHVVSDNNVFQGLVVNGNTDAAGFGLENADNNVFLSNYIGTDTTGTVRKPNFAGIALTNAHNVVIGGTNGVSVGGSCTGDCNLISGNNYHGIVLNTSTSNARVIGNFIGLNVNGSASLLNNEDGVLIANAHDNVVGGDTAQERNYIGGNHVIGIEIGLQNSYNNLIQGNYIGTNSRGTAAVAGNGAGVMLDNSAHDNIIDNNLISGAGDFGVMVFYSAVRTEIKYNRIGMTATTDDAIGNGKVGVELQTGSNSIHNNRIAYSGLDGVLVKQGSNNLISQNSIFGNARYGINVSATHLQNLPVIASATVSGSTMTVKGNLNSRANVRYTLEFFQSPGCDLVFGHAVGEGKVYLGSTQVTTDGNGNASFSASLNGATGQGVVTGTATDSQNNTSEFSYCHAVTLVSSVPSKPLLLTPTNNQQVTVNPPHLVWAPSADADRYNVVIRVDGRKGTKVNTATVSTESYTPPSLASGKTYYWRVTACNSVGCTKSDMYTFTLP